jgi:hypothetical protein
MMGVRDISIDGPVVENHQFFLQSLDSLWQAQTRMATMSYLLLVPDIDLDLEE